MADRVFEEKRLAEIYDALDPDRSDLDPYVAMVEEFGATSVLDIGCGTGTLAYLLATRGHQVVGVDPAAASLDVARSKAGADRVRWIHGTVDSLDVRVDVALMTGNVAQVFVDDWAATLIAVRRALVPGGRFVFETRVPERQAWQSWNRAASHSVADVAGGVESWVDLLSVADDLVSFRWTFVFASDGAVLTSDSTLRFRSQPELVRSLEAAGFRIDEVRDAPDRPGLEWVFVTTAV